MRQVILTSAVIIAIALVAVFWVIPEATGEDVDWPEVPGVTKKITYVNTIEVKCCTGPKSVTIMGYTLAKRNVPASIGPFFWGSSTFKGEVVVESFKSGHKIDSDECGVRIFKEWWESYNCETYELNNIDLGVEGTGEYMIKVTLYDEDGNWVDSTSTTINI